jgi:hypothetical protein
MTGVVTAVHAKDIDALPRILCHHDYQMKNLLYISATKSLHVIDTDSGFYMTRLWDVIFLLFGGDDAPFYYSYSDQVVTTTISPQTPPPLNSASSTPKSTASGPAGAGGAGGAGAGAVTITAPTATKNDVIYLQRVKLALELYVKHYGAPFSEEERRCFFSLLQLRLASILWHWLESKHEIARSKAVIDLWLFLSQNREAIVNMLPMK